MFYAGSYRVEKFKNLRSIPEVLTRKSELKNGLIFVISDLYLPTNDNYNLEDDIFLKTKKFLNVLMKQRNVFNNIEAVVLNGNIVKTTENVAKSCLTNQQLSNVIDKRSMAYIFLHSLIAASTGLPIYYVRGDEDCFMNNPSLPVEFRGILKPCNALYIDDTLFIHGHTGVLFHQEEQNKVVTTEDEELAQKESVNSIIEELNCNVVISNCTLKTHKNKRERVIRVGSFKENGFTVITTNPFEISPLTP